MKPKLFIIALAATMLMACQQSDPGFDKIDQTQIMGQFTCVLNPFDSNDSVLCLTDIQSVDIVTNDSAYITTLERMLAEATGGIDRYPQTYQFYGIVHYGIFPDSMIFYIVKENGLISLVDDDKRSLKDSLEITVNTLWGNVRTRSETIYLYPRPEDNQRPPISDIFLDDYVEYRGKDNGPQPLIFDSVTPEGKTILCVDGTYGPFFCSTWKWMNEK